MDNEEDDLDKAIFEGEIELDEKKADELRAIQMFLKEWPSQAKELRKHLSDFHATRKGIISKVDCLRDRKMSIARVNREHNREQFGCKKQSFLGNYIGIYGVLAAPFSGGASLLLSGGSTLVNATGMYREYKADEQHVSETSQLMKECSSLQENIQKSFSKLESTVNKIEEIIKQPAKIDRQILLIHPPNITGSSNNAQKAIRLAECLSLPLKYIDRVLSVQKCVTVATYVEFNQSFLIVNSSISVVKSLTESTIQLKPILTACYSSSMVVQTSLNGVVTLSRNGVSMQIVKTGMSINKLSASISTTVGDLTIKQSCTVFRVNKMKKVVTVSRKSTNTAKCISKTAMAVGFASLCYDAYRIYNHEAPTESQTEKDIEKLIDDCERNLAALDKFIEMAEVELKSGDQMYKEMC